MITNDNSYSFYCQTNMTNGKKYFCKSKNIKKRWGKNGRGYTNNHDTIFSNAIMKYGWDGFKHEIIASNLSPDEAAESVHTDIRNLSNCLHGRSKTCGGFHWQFADEGGS